MSNKLGELKAIVEAMLVENETITTRAVVRRSAGLFKHATDVTRHAHRRSMVAEYADRQARIRAGILRSSKSSRHTIERQLADTKLEVERLQGQRELLVASHKMMVLAVSEMGGFQVWRRFFDHYKSALDTLEALGALPATKVEKLSEARRQAPQRGDK